MDNIELEDEDEESHEAAEDQLDHEDEVDVTVDMGGDLPDVHDSDIHLGTDITNAHGKRRKSDFSLEGDMEPGTADFDGSISETFGVFGFSL
jgi:hypothetical protein